MHCLCSCTCVVVLLMSIITETHNSKIRSMRLVKCTETLSENNLVPSNIGKNRNSAKLKNFANRARPLFKGLTKRTKSSYADKESESPTELKKDIDNKLNNIYQYNTKDKENNERKEKKLIYYIRNRYDHNARGSFNDDYKDETGFELGRPFNTEENVSKYEDDVKEANNNETDTMNMNFKMGDIKAIDGPGNKSSKEQMVEFTQKMYRNLLQLDLKPGLSPRRNTTDMDDASEEFHFKTNASRDDNDNTSPADLFAEMADHGTNEPSHSNMDTSVAKQLAQKVRVLCWIMTEASRHGSNAAYVKATWGRRCNKQVFMSSAKDPYLPAVNLHVGDGQEHSWEKTMEAFSYVHNQYRNEAEWFLKADDDTYVIMENLRFMLAEFDSTQPLYLGCRFKPYTKQGYMSGGAGYVLSRAALDRLNRAFQIPNMCNMHSTSAEDVELGKCLERIGVRAMDTRDPFGRGRFFPFPLRDHLFPDKKKMGWYYDYLYYPEKEGQECCSNTAISFHGLQGRDMYILDYLIYHLRPHSDQLLVTKTENTFEVETTEQKVKTNILPVAEIHYNVLD